MPWRRGQRGDAPAAGRSGEGAGGSPGDARARGAQAWAVLDTLECGQSCRRAGAECPGDGCAEARGRAPAGVRQGPRGGCSQARRRAAQHHGSSGHPRARTMVVECSRAKDACGRVDCGVHQNRSRSHYGKTHTRPLLLNIDRPLLTRWVGGTTGFCVLNTRSTPPIKQHDSSAEYPVPMNQCDERNTSGSARNRGTARTQVSMSFV